MTLNRAMFVMEYVQFQLYQELKMAINNFICIIKIRILIPTIL